MEASDRIGQLAVRSTRNERGRLSPMWPTTQLKESHEGSPTVSTTSYKK